MKKILLLCAIFINGFVYAETKTTASAGDWNDASTWTGGLPASTDDIVIAHNVVLTASDNRSVNSITINSDKTLTLNSVLTVATTSVNGGTMYINADGEYSQTAGTFTNNFYIYGYAGAIIELGSSVSSLSNNGPIFLYSSSSLFANFKTSVYTESGFGTITYSRYINGTDYWDLIGAPLKGQTISSFLAANNDIATNSSGGVESYAIGVYTNTAAAASAGTTWNNYNDDGNPVGSSVFSQAIGYQMSTDGTSTGSEVTFEGNVETSSVALTVTTNEAGSSNASDGTKFALIANPYPSYLDVTTFLNAHSATQLHAAHVAVYGWDGTGYDTYSLASPGNNIAPGQGFMIGVAGSNGTTQTITFTTAMQTKTGSGDFSEYDLVNDRAELFINLNQNNTDKQTKLFFIENMTDGLDLGYDAATLDIGDYSIYSRLVANDEGVNMDHQSVAYSEVNDKVIPLGIHAEAGEEAIISISHNTTNTSTYVYLEDALQGTFTNLKETDFVITPDSDLQGVGRFFIHTSASTMSNEDATTNLLSVFKLDRNNFITVEGLSTESNQTNLKLYNILGKEVLSTTLLNNTNTQTISTEGLSTGIYVIKLESGNNLLTKKLIIK